MRERVSGRGGEGGGRRGRKSASGCRTDPGRKIMRRWIKSKSSSYVSKSVSFSAFLLNDEKYS